MSDRPAKKQNTLFVGALAKGLKLLRAFDETHTDLSLGDLASRTGLDKSAVQRLANTLHVEGMLVKDPATRRYRPSHQWLEMAYAYYWSDPLIGRAMPKLIELSRDIGETVNLAELSGEHIIYALRLPTQRTHFAATIAGRRLPALSTSAGRAMLATWRPEDREAAVRDWPIASFTPATTRDRGTIRDLIEDAAVRGYAISRSEVILNEVGVAAPIVAPDGRAAAAIHVSVSGHSYDLDRINRDIAPAIQDAANTILA
ncbi:IclR family transcriptional regulator [Tranquillimonas alkanivorans]|uniref:Transcriptional regulator, IclR family n=1 Tax=Tranquillimonas alkanivorans TaxID=441119 RepID=A0A1I5Q405_9RHOB|nr:IclR family transcriptional regulator [Tranquillimonas alkanivorans]SFP40942.1 transcriptional regulator, IclR family [Tranquillimonas alkanivorans]